MSSIQCAIKEIKESPLRQEIEFENFVAKFIKQCYGLVWTDENKIQFYISITCEGEGRLKVSLSPKRLLQWYDRVWKITKFDLDTIMFKVLTNAGGTVRKSGDYFWEVTFLV